MNADLGLGRGGREASLRVGKQRKPSREAHKFRARLGHIGFLNNQLRPPRNLKVGGESWNFCSVGGYLPGMHKALGPTSSVRETWWNGTREDSDPTADEGKPDLKRCPSDKELLRRHKRALRDEKQFPFYRAIREDSQGK